MELILSRYKHEPVAIKVTKAWWSNEEIIQIEYEDGYGIIENAILEDCWGCHTITGAFLVEGDIEHWSLVVELDEKEAEFFGCEPCVCFTVENPEDCYKLEGFMLNAVVGRPEVRCQLQAWLRVLYEKQ